MAKKTLYWVLTRDKWLDILSNHVEQNCLGCECVKEIGFTTNRFYFCLRVSKISGIAEPKPSCIKVEKLPCFHFIIEKTFKRQKGFYVFCLGINCYARNGQNNFKSILRVLL